MKQQAPPLTYTKYLQIDELLSLQIPLSQAPEHDEMLFIIIHQVYELWFKQVLHELDYLYKLFINNDRSHAIATLRRILTIFKTLITQLDVLETMTPLEFLSFRDWLESASGFQSYQFRELEFILGYKRRHTLNHYPQDSQAYILLQSRYQAPTIWDAFLKFLQQNGYQVPARKDVTQPVEASIDVQEILIRIYRDNYMLMRVCERLVDLDEAIQEWRYRHVKMVERTIGTKKGTGGSAGTAYLQTTLFKSLFPDLWLIRAEL